MDAASARRARILFWVAIALIVGSAALSGPSDTASDILGLLSGLTVLAIAWMYWEARSVPEAAAGQVSIVWPVVLTLTGLAVAAGNLVRLL